MIRKTSFILRLSVLWLFLLICLPVFAFANNISLEHRIKAAFLYKFCHYVTWPDEAFNGANNLNKPIEIGVVGVDDIAQELQRITRGRDVGGRALSVHAYTPETVPEKLHLLFIGRSTVRNNPDWLTRFKSKPVLLVTDIPNGLDIGSGINFLIDGERVRFDISLTTIKAHQLQVGSQLLSVARQIRGGEE
ncbi:YfiR family protein [Methylophaga sp. OBS4]|uniref:YfiR family protein n=1 Tax=Methylophaga sp. OBS4 TaxID=2991935 RepID=UPI002258863A|nr:YfiR family protein [Methylophaga sp. OBS4]MCX4187560.1 YfiR family protein [Methylophaga sp. OBS4]